MRIRGFTLIELSIALVIIGLLVAAIVGGQALIQQSRLLSVLTDVNKFKSALSNFRQKYNSFPGDMIDATSYWAASANGDGDGQVEFTAGPPVYENLRAWQQLVLDGQIPGNYTGSLSGGNFIAGINLPTSKIAGATFDLQYHNLAVGKTGNAVILATINAATIDFAALSPVDAQTLDEKSDDGLANSGDVITYKGTNVANGTCLTGADGTGYKLDVNDSRCRMFFFIR